MFSCKLYCKYIIDTLCDNIHIFKKNKIISDLLYEDIYNSYLKLEELINIENNC